MESAAVPVALCAASSTAIDSPQPEAPQAASAGMQCQRPEVTLDPGRVRVRVGRQRKTGALKQMHLDFGQACWLTGLWSACQLSPSVERLTTPGLTSGSV